MRTTLKLWCCGGSGGEGPLADVMDVRERLSQAPCGVSQHLSPVDYVVGCSYSQGASSCCLLTCAKLGSSKLCMTQIHVRQICLTHAAAIARSSTCHPQDLAYRKLQCGAQQHTCTAQNLLCSCPGCCLDTACLKGFHTGGSGVPVSGYFSYRYLDTGTPKPPVWKPFKHAIVRQKSNLKKAKGV